MTLHDLGEPTKRLLDYGSMMLAGVSGATIMAGLNMAAVVIAILSGLVSLSWGLCRWRDRLKYGPPKND